MKLHHHSKPLKFYYVSLIFAVTLFLFIQQRIVYAVEKVTSTEKESIVQVGDEIGENGTRQIFYINNFDQKKFITQSNYTNANPSFDGREIVWMGQVDGAWQIFLYSLSTKTAIQLSHGGNNLNPSVSRGNVAWEGWVSRQSGEEGWQIFYFNGEKVQIVTQEDSAISPLLFDGDIFFSRKDDEGTWKIRKYSPDKKRISEIVGTETYKYFEFKDGRITKKRPVIQASLLPPPKAKVTPPKRRIVIPDPVETLMNFFSTPQPDEVAEDGIEASDEATIENQEDTEVSPQPSASASSEPTPLPTVTAEDILKEMIQLTPTPFQTPEASSSASPQAQPTPEPTTF